MFFFFLFLLDHLLKISKGILGTQVYTSANPQHKYWRSVNI